MATTMIERTVIIPDMDNDGNSLLAQQERFQYRLLDIAGGYTQDNVTGAWRGDDGTIYRDTSRRYTVVCTPEQDKALAAILPETCEACRQECIFTATQRKVVNFVAAPIAVKAS